MTTITVVIPVFNQTSFLAEAIESVRAQTFQPLEILVIDDGSSEPVAHRAAEFPGVTFVRREHAGVSATRNHGSEIAAGEYLSFLDADDIWLPEKLATQVKLMSGPSAAEVVFPRYLNFIHRGSDRPEYIKDADLVKPSPCITGMLIRKETFANVGPFNTSYDHGEDTEWLLRAKELGLHCVTQDEVTIKRRIHGNNLSSNLAQSRTNALDMLRASIVRKRFSSIPSKP